MRTLPTILAYCFVLPAANMIVPSDIESFLAQPQVEKLEKEVQILTNKAYVMEGRVKKAERAKAKAEEALALSEEEVARLKALLDAALADSGSGSAAASALRKQLADLQAEMEALRQKLHAKDEECDGLKHELVGLRTQLTAAKVGECTVLYCAAVGEHVVLACWRITHTAKLVAHTCPGDLTSLATRPPPFLAVPVSGLRRYSPTSV
jgi:hypothetical protein